MSIINLLKNDIWSEADIVNAGRASVRSVVSETRQGELQTVLLGHISHMRTATPSELAEIALVQSLMEAQVIANDEARADMSLLQRTLGYEDAKAWLNKPPEPATIDVASQELDADGNPIMTTEPNPLYMQDVANRAAAQAVIDAATQPVLDLYALRHPVIVAVEPVIPVEAV